MGSHFKANLAEHSPLGSQHKPDHIQPHKHHQASWVISFNNDISGATELVTSGSLAANHSARSSSIRWMSTDQCHARLAVVSHPVLEPFLWLCFYQRELALPPSRGNGYRSVPLYPISPASHPLVKLGCLGAGRFLLDFVPSPLC